MNPGGGNGFSAGVGGASPNLNYLGGITITMYVSISKMCHRLAEQEQDSMLLSNVCVD